VVSEPADVAFSDPDTRVKGLRACEIDFWQNDGHQELQAGWEWSRYILSSYVENIMVFFHDHRPQGSWSLEARVVVVLAR
jgi:hypothetical protein